MSVIVVTDDTTRSELAETLALLNTDAKALRRRGYVGVAGAEYAKVHSIINSVLDDYQFASA